MEVHIVHDFKYTMHQLDTAILRVLSHERKFTVERSSATNHNCRKESSVITAAL